MSADPARVLRFFRYVHADTVGEAIVGYFAYRWRASVCFFSGPSLGHDWDGQHSLFQACRRCDKTWLGNL